MMADENFIVQRVVDFFVFTNSFEVEHGNFIIFELFPFIYLESIRFVCFIVPLSLCRNVCWKNLMLL